MELRAYMIKHHFTPATFAKELGKKKKRQNVEHWIKNGATIELNDFGFRIRLKSGYIVYDAVISV